MKINFILLSLMNSVIMEYGGFFTFMGNYFGENTGIFVFFT